MQSKPKVEDMTTCEGCICLGRFSSGTPYCDYLSVVGTRRPCPAGPKCTAKIEGRRKVGFARELY